MINILLNNITELFSLFGVAQLQIHKGKKDLHNDLAEYDRMLFETIIKVKAEIKSIRIFSGKIELEKLLNELFNLKSQCEKNNDWDVELLFNLDGKEYRLKPEILLNYVKVQLSYINELIEYINSELAKIPTPQQTETKTDKIKSELGKYGFFELPKVKQISEQSKQSLIELISTKGLPYSIAMFDFLDFLNHIKNEHFKTKYKLNIEVAKWFNSDKEGRAVKGNISSLSDYSTENKSKYTAHTHKETVIKDYQKLK